MVICHRGTSLGGSFSADYTPCPGTLYARTLSSGGFAGWRIQMSVSSPVPSPAQQEDFLTILNVDHIEFWVGNALQAAQYYRNSFGFDIVAFAGPETGVRDRASYA